MADDYDFQIDTLKFRAAVSDQFPYSRNTAPFRKEQFDAAPTPGDQSLTGWWVRGQLSFHKGAGLNYYEVLEGDEILNRFTSSRNVHVWDSGKVTLRPEMNTKYTKPNITSGRAGRGNAFFYRTDLDVWGTSMAAQDQLDMGLGEDYSNGVTSSGEYCYASYTYAGPNYGIARAAWTGVSFDFAESVYNTATTPFANIWYAKGRLWALDVDGALYILDATPSGTWPITDLGTPVATVPQSFDSAGFYSSLTDGGSAVFLSMADNIVYAFTLDDDGTVPTLTAPISVLELPQDEEISCIRAHLGILTIVTNVGVRFAQIDGPYLVVGPVVVEWFGTECESIAAIGSKVYALGTTVVGEEVGCYEFDLSQNVGDNPLVFPYAMVWRTTTQIGGRHGAQEAGDGDLTIYAGGEIYSTRLNDDELEPVGEIITAYHRFGTLDDKNFRKVSIRAEGSGVLEVLQIDGEGTETSLGSMFASAGEQSFDLTIGAAERMALRITLDRDGVDATTGPTLLGYQIKALPVPERQRILKWPLSIQDTNKLRRGTGVGRAGRAYADITALEELEQTQAVVTFTDHRTGETGTAYIDTVEFQGDTPSGPTTSGFGGVAYVTLRVLT